jgi:pyruvate dehydrogenase E2 component (dihydrolipoamide acetyltransferase)
MPALSPTMTEGTLVRWLVQEGDEVKSGDVVAEIETDKATMEVEGVDEGIVGRLCVAAGTEGVAVNSVLAVLLEEGEGEEAVEAALQGASGVPRADAKEGGAKERVAKEGDVKEGGAKEGDAKEGDVKQEGQEKREVRGNRVRISPLARKLASSHGLEVSAIEGSGPHGRIIKRDIDRAVLEGKTSVVRSGDHVGSEGAGLPRRDREDPLFPNSVLVPHSGMRKVIARRLTESKRDIPHFYLSVDVVIDAMLLFRQRVNEMGGGSYKVSLNDIVVKAVAHALMKEDKANAGWTEEGIRYFESADVSVAVAIEGGLVTPVVREAESLGLLEISRRIKDLALRAREGKLLPEEYQGGTFSVSNLGMFGVDNFQAVINPPQSCILAVGCGREVLVLRDGEVEKETVMTLTLSVDHRVVDGALAARYLSALKGFLEEPALMIL